MSSIPLINVGTAAKMSVTTQYQRVNHPETLSNNEIGGNEMSNGSAIIAILDGEVSSDTAFAMLISPTRRLYAISIPGTKNE